VPELWVEGMVKRKLVVLYADLRISVPFYLPDDFESSGIQPEEWLQRVKEDPEFRHEVFMDNVLDVLSGLADLALQDVQDIGVEIREISHEAKGV